MLKPKQFLRTVGVRAPQSGQKAGETFRIGMVAAGYAGGRPQIQFDDDDAASTRTYPKAKGLVLAAGDRVLVAMAGQGGSGVVLCVIE